MKPKLEILDNEKIEQICFHNQSFICQPSKEKRELSSSKQFGDLNSYP